MIAISEVMMPIWRSSRPRYRLTFEALESTERRLERVAGRVLDDVEVVPLAPKEVVCLTELLGI